MKRIILILLVLIFQSCNDDFDLNQLSRPIVVIAVSKPDNSSNGSIILKDSKDFIRTFYGGNALGSALIKSYNLGDTIK